MGERRMYPELLGDLAAISPEEIWVGLQEIPAGYSSFGPRAEWHAWYHYLLPQLLPRGHERYITESIFELLITGFMAIYPNGIYSAPYKRFREDTLLTLGRCMMEPNCWRGREIAVGEILHRDNRNPAGVWMWWDASGDLSASMFFCLKYLPKDLVLGWLRSVLEIPSAHWRAQIIAWAVGAHDMLAGVHDWPSEWKIDSVPSVTWEWSHCLRAELATQDDSGALPMRALIPDAAREDALHLLHRYFNGDVFLEWLESISRFDYLQAELGTIPSTFESLYVDKPKHSTSKERA